MRKLNMVWFYDLSVKNHVSFEWLFEISIYKVLIRCVLYWKKMKQLTLFIWQNGCEWKCLLFNDCQSKIYSPYCFLFKIFIKTVCTKYISFVEFELDHDSVRQLPSEIERLRPLIRNSGVYDATVSHLPEQIGRLPRNLPNLCYLYMPKNNLTDLIAIGTYGNNTICNKYFYFNINRIWFLPITNVLCSWLISARSW